MFERFSESLIKSIVIAQEEAGKLGWLVVGTEFLLLGVLSTTEGLAARALNSQGVNFLNVQLEVKRKVGFGNDFDYTLGTRFTPSAKALLKKLAQRAKVNDENVSSRHLLLALLEMYSVGSKPSGAIEILRVLKVDLDKLQRELVCFRSETEIDVVLAEPRLRLSNTDIVERFDDSMIRAIVFSQRKSWEGEAGLVELRHLILGLIHADATIAELFTRAGYEFREQMKKIKFLGGAIEDSVIGAIPFSTEVKDVLEQSGSSPGSIGQRLITPKHVLLRLLSSPDIVKAECLEKLVADCQILENAIQASPGLILPMPVRTKPYQVTETVELPKPYDPTDDAATLEQKIFQWEFEAELCRRVEKEATIQAEICRQALAEMLTEEG